MGAPHLHLFACIGLLAAACSRTPAAPQTFGITPPAAWGPAVEDKMDQWSGGMADSTDEILDRFIEQYRRWSPTTQVEEQTSDRAVVRFDFADVTRGMAREAGVTVPLSTTKPLNRRLLIEVQPDGGDVAVRLRSFDIAG